MMSKGEKSIKIEDCVLCPLTEWATTKVTVGKGIGNEITRRVVIVADSKNWMLRQQSKDGVFSPLGNYFPGFKLLLQRVKQLHGIEPLEVAAKVVERLNELMGVHEIKGSMDIEELGKTIDHTFKVNFNAHDNVLGRVFKGEKEEAVIEKPRKMNYRDMSIRDIIAHAEKHRPVGTSPV